uniref:Integrase, catalytic region, zinc finger, CCHC-type, peptidase aspartic, catalytic n=1 Tax=Tanacetum cinerariifolium TaxID=118510 RepID=A0A699GNW3_TANCI|nr:hypothetical protein [Tanacetum cinerariifolium]
MVAEGDGWDGGDVVRDAMMMLVSSWGGREGGGDEWLCCVVVEMRIFSSCSTSKVQKKTQLSRSRCMNSLGEVNSQFKFLSETLQDFGTMPIFKRTFSQDLDLLQHHLTKDILSQTDCKTTLTKLITTFENAFNSEFKERMQKYTRFDAQSFKDAMTFQALKLDSIVMENTCSRKENSNSEPAFNKSVKQSSLDSETKDVCAIKYKMLKAKERCMTYFRSLHSHLQVLSKEDLKGTRIEHGLKRAFMSLFGQDVDTFTSTMLLNTQESKIDTGKAVNNDLIVIESSGTKSEVQDDNIRSKNDTDADDADIRLIYDEEPMAKTTDYSKQSLDYENILLKKTVTQFQKDFSRMEAHCIALELKYQNQALKSGQHGQILNETSNKAKIKKEINVTATMNIELEHSMAKLRKKNKTLKKHYKDLYDFIKITRSKTIEQTTSLLANNANLEAQIQEKVFAIAALKNNLRKLKGYSVDTKFAKTLVLGKSILQYLRNQSVVRQPNAFKSERPQMSKLRFASQVDVNNNWSRLVTQHYLTKKRESAFAKPDHMIASSSSRNSSKNMPRFSSNDMEVNSRVMIQSHKTRNNNKPVDQKSHTQKHGRQIFRGHRFSANKTSAVYEKTSPRSDLRWKPTGRIFKSVGLRWIPTGKLFDSCISKVDSEPPHGSNVDIPNIHKCKQTLDVTA